MDHDDYAEPLPGIDPQRWTYEPDEECPTPCDVCGEWIAAGQPVHTSTSRALRYSSDEDDGADLHERDVSWCDACDGRGAGLGRRMGRTVTREHRCDCGCVERAA